MRANLPRPKILSLPSRATREPRPTKGGSRVWWKVAQYVLLIAAMVAAVVGILFVLAALVWHGSGIADVPLTPAG